MPNIKPYTSDMEAGMVPVYRQVFSEYPWLEDWSYADVQESLSEPELRWWVAIDGDRVVGFTAWLVTDSATLAARLKVPPECLPASKIAYLAEVGTLEAYRGQGLAKQLTSVGEVWANGQGGTQTVLRTRPNAITYPWYTSKGYRVLHQYEDGRVVLGK